MEITNEAAISLMAVLNREYGLLIISGTGRIVMESLQMVSNLALEAGDIIWVMKAAGIRSAIQRSRLL